MHTEPFKTYESPSRSMVISMLVASLDATCGSVIRKAERILPSSNGSSQRRFCCSVPYLAMTSMLPVSGAAQLVAYPSISIPYTSTSHDSRL
jgi:hypothetical protein